MVCVELDNTLDDLKLSTEQMGHFWQHLTEQAVLRLTRLKPEIVTRPPR